jgi:hypothetical protein
MRGFRWLIRAEVVYSVLGARVGYDAPYTDPT